MTQASAPSKAQTRESLADIGTPEDKFGSLAPFAGVPLKSIFRRAGQPQQAASEGTDALKQNMAVL